MDKTLGETIYNLRKEKNMTQLELANKLNVTDKAVSKWERNLSYPDINSIPKLAEVLEVDVNELLKIKQKSKANESPNIINLVFKAVALAMGVAVVVTNILKVTDVNSSLIMLGIGLFSLAIVNFNIE